MLGFDYPTNLQNLIDQVPWDIDLGDEPERFFTESGPTPGMPGDQRRVVRVRVRTRGVGILESALPAFQRGPQPFALYSVDISRRGMGVLMAETCYPEEIVRILMPTVWLRGKVVRTARCTTRCYHIGLRLLESQPPCPEAFHWAETVTH